MAEISQVLKLPVRRPLYTQRVFKPICSHFPVTIALLFCSLLLVLPREGAAKGRANHSSPLVHSRQLIVVTTSDWSAVDGILRRYERGAPRKPWRPMGDPVPVVVGKKGLGWGIGVAAISAQKPGDPVKVEGDLKSPAGIFRFGTEFGDAPAKPVSWAMPYRALTPTIECVDDVHSRFYNRVVDRSSVAADWNSSEHMLKVGKYYRWGVVVKQNPRGRPEAGSCVFMHIWGGAGIGTEGCTAMEEPNVKAILAWLRPAADPLLVQMPLPQYRQVEKRLHLPAE